MKIYLVFSGGDLLHAYSDEKKAKVAAFDAYCNEPHEPVEEILRDYLEGYKVDELTLGEFFESEFGENDIIIEEVELD